MKNPIKQYFLFLSRGPFVFSLIVFIIVIIAGVIYLKIDEVNATIFFNKYALMFAAIIFVNMCLVYFIRHKCITSSDDDYQNTIFSVLVTKEGKKIILTKDIWEKGKKYSVTTKNYYSLSMYDGEAKGRTETDFCISGKYKNSLVKVSVTLNLEYHGMIDRLDLFALLLKNAPGSEPLSLDDYLKKVFNNVNEENQPKFDEIISRYAKLTISDAEFLSEILDVIEFPE